jgi:hypothetical protein
VWLHPWYNFWTASLTSAPAAFLHDIASIELALGWALVIGFLRKTVYSGGIILSLMIWSIVEGFGGPYGSGSRSTDVGTAIMYAFIFVAIIIIERSYALSFVLWSYLVTKSSFTSTNIFSFFTCFHLLPISLLLLPSFFTCFQLLLCYQKDKTVREL